jgi:ubiquinone/menaquinone biosynthesis C-methylase UbiE
MSRTYSRVLASYYDRIYFWKPYAAEAEAIKKLISEYKQAKGKDLLDVACGTGKHICYLKDEFHCVGTDLSEPMLVQARKNNPDIVFHRADMIRLNLHKQFDAIICLFSAIGYVRTYANLERTLRNFHSHLKSGGVVIIEPWFTRAAYKKGAPHMTTYSDDHTKVARLNVSKIRGNLSVLDIYYLIAERNETVRHFVDRHEVGMFEFKRILALMRKTGFQAKFLRGKLNKAKGPDDRGVCVGVRI